MKETIIVAVIAALIVIFGVVIAHAQEANITRYDTAKYDIYVHDGDTFHVFDEAGGLVSKVRLWGYDAPELKERCVDGAAGQYQCGFESKVALTQLISEGSILVCEKKGKSYDRVVMKCFIGGDDIGEVMVRSGHGEAVWDRTQGTTYGAKLQRYMREAQDYKRGMWAGF